MVERIDSKIIGVGEYAATNTPGESIKTYALGSCVAVIFLDPQTKTVGMVHVALPDSAIDLQRANSLPGYFADTGIPALLTRMAALGSAQVGPKFMVKLVGGANVMDAGERFNIGKRNLLAIKKILWQLKLGAVAEETGGSVSRTVLVEVDTGKVFISTGDGLKLAI